MWDIAIFHILQRCLKKIQGMRHWNTGETSVKSKI